MNRTPKRHTPKRVQRGYASLGTERSPHAMGFVLASPAPTLTKTVKRGR